MTLDEIIRDCQRAVGADDDGKPGIDTWTRIHTKLIGVKSNADPVEISGKVDARSEKNIATLHPKVQPYARALIQKAAAKGWKFVITSGLRTYAEQDALYAKGRTAAGPKVTNAKAGSSWHNHGCSFDVTLFNGSIPVWESPLYTAIGAIGEDIGLEWGGRWKNPVDYPHFQMTNGKSISQARALHAQGKTVFD